MLASHTLLVGAGIYTVYMLTLFSVKRKLDERSLKIFLQQIGICFKLSSQLSIIHQSVWYMFVLDCCWNSLRRLSKLTNAY